MEEVLLLKCGELVLKGLNRIKFEERLLKNLRRSLSAAGEFNIYALQSTVYVEPKEGADIEQALERVKRVFGIVSISRAAVCQKEIEAICRTAGEYLSSQLASCATFKVAAKRADKAFPLTSPQIGAEVGGYLHDLYPHLVPKMEEPEITVTVEVRDRLAYIAGKKYRGAGGLPSGISGRAMLLLSGGIDSPVAGHMMAKRGLELGAVHFYSYPYTSVEAKDKVLELAGILSRYSAKLTVSLVPFTEIQQQIAQHCHEDYYTIIMRRMMMRIAEMVALHQDCGALITGESLAQVASQTMEALHATGAVCTIPVFRPVIGMDKEEIVERARQIGTFETSSLPFEDCCTVFTPRHPQTKPKLENVLREEEGLDIQALCIKAFNGIERVTVG